MPKTYFAAVSRGTSAKALGDVVWQILGLRAKFGAALVLVLMCPKISALTVQQQQLKDTPCRAVPELHIKVSCEREQRTPRHLLIMPLNLLQANIRQEPIRFLNRKARVTYGIPACARGTPYRERPSERLWQIHAARPLVQRRRGHRISRPDRVYGIHRCGS